MKAIIPKELGKKLAKDVTELGSKTIEFTNEMKELTESNLIKEISKHKDFLDGSLNTIHNKSLEALEAENSRYFSEKLLENTDYRAIEKSTIENKEALSFEEKLKIKKETGWSDEIINSIRSIEEFEVYKSIGLKESNVNGRPCLIRNDIDWEQKDSVGRTNIERAELGLSPINRNGEVIELHHIGQKKEAPFAELTQEEHRGRENYLKLHDFQKESEIDETQFNRERIEHWKARGKIGG
jgi:hypothetical protein